MSPVQGSKEPTTPAIGVSRTRWQNSGRFLKYCRGISFIEHLQLVWPHLCRQMWVRCTQSWFSSWFCRSSGCRSPPSQMSAAIDEQKMRWILSSGSRWGGSKFILFILSNAVLSRTNWSSSTLRATSRSPCWRTTSAKRAASRTSCTNTCASSNSPTMIWREPKGKSAIKYGCALKRPARRWALAQKCTFRLGFRLYKVGVDH